jgi:LytR_cpsA_psr family
LLTAFTTGVVWIVLAYHGLANDLETARGRVPGSVSANLVPGGSFLDDPQVTLLLPGATDQDGTAPLALGTDPAKRTIALFSLPTIGEQSNEGAVVRQASRLVGTPVNHVLLMSPQDLGAIVDVVGPLTVLNRSAVDFTLADGGYIHFPPGDVLLDGNAALRFMRGSGESARADREQLILEAIVSRLLRHRTIGDLADVAHSIVAVADTDLTASDVLDLAWLRFHSDVLVRCTAASDQGNGLGTIARRQFLSGSTGVAEANPEACRTTSLADSPFPLPPKQFVAGFGAAYPHLWQIGMGVLAATALILLLVMLRRPALAAAEQTLGRIRGIDVNPLANVSLARLPRRRPRRPLRVSGAVAGFRQNRGEVVLYLLSILLSVGVALLILFWTTR